MSGDKNRERTFVEPRPAAAAPHAAAPIPTRAWTRGPHTLRIRTSRLRHRLESDD
eukprot:gene813-60276_t